ncbi:hypothetical protein F2Q65_09390 [Thiohalocapsa marina]|uniref:Uncharacterized protein n=1 Tax=Thiohalocapsa marina TaxID=424902 RepID=A0A5M8FSM4_9GAMM|nr:hypothetical protein [Thiohalocapsa marina]KAA6185332.1 hypothetical protein F2Q65_09390 [Thiohalocapsa marina]
MTTRIRSILEQLEQTREDLLALSDDIWLSIDHNDSQALEDGVAFKKQYNAKVAAFDKLAGELSALVQQFTAVKLDDGTSEGDRSARGRERTNRDLDQYQAHGLDEDFTFKRPYGFRLEEEAQSDIKTWRRLYELICLSLQKRDPGRFSRLPDDPRFTTRRGNPVFSRDPLALRSAMPLPGGIYAEVNLSANHLRDQMKLLLMKSTFRSGTSYSKDSRQDQTRDYCLGQVFAVF